MLGKCLVLASPCFAAVDYATEYGCLTDMKPITMLPVRNGNEDDREIHFYSNASWWSRLGLITQPCRSFCRIQKILPHESSCPAQAN